MNEQSLEAAELMGSLPQYFRVEITSPLLQELRTGKVMIRRHVRQMVCGGEGDTNQVLHPSEQFHVSPLS